MGSKTVAETLAKARTASGLTVRGLAPLILKETGAPISPSYVTDLEKGRGLPSDFVAVQFAKVLGLDAETFLRQVRRERVQ